MRRTCDPPSAMLKIPICLVAPISKWEPSCATSGSGLPSPSPETSGALAPGANNPAQRRAVLNHMAQFLSTLGVFLTLAPVECLFVLEELLLLQ